MADDPWKMTKVKKSVWDRLDKLRKDYGLGPDWRDRPEMSLSDGIKFLLDIHDELKEKGVEIERERQYGYGYSDPTMKLTFPDPKEADGSDSEEESS